MNRYLCLHRSSINGFTDTREHLAIRLLPARLEHVEAEADPGAAENHILVREVHLQITGAGPRLALNSLPARIIRAELLVGDVRFVDRVLLPLVYTGASEFSCTTEHGESFRVRGGGVALVFVDNERFIRAERDAGEPGQSP